MNKSIRTPFTRYRHSIELNVDANVRTSIATFLKVYEKSADQAFRTLITDIADGSGAGISKESTWFQAIRELFDHLREYPGKAQDEAKKKYIEVLRVLSEAASSEKTWSVIKALFEQDMDILSLWQFSPYRSMLSNPSPYRDKDGKVYRHEVIEGNEEVVQVIDGQTLAEARYSYITDDIYSKYGSMGLMLRLCRLVFIELSIEQKTDDFSLVRFVMSEDSSGYNTWFLQGYWQVNSAKYARTIKWHPKDYYADLSWLESDLSLIAAKSADVQSQETTHPEAPVVMEESDQTFYQKSIEGYSLQYEIALDTNVFISDELDTFPDEVFIDFEGRLIRWVNGSLHRYPVLIIPTNDQTYEDAMQIARRFVSMIIFDNPYISMRESANVGHPVNYYPAMIKQPRLPSINSISAEWINRKAIATTPNAWTALSFYKEAKNSESVFYQFLNYYKIVQRAFLQANGSEDSRACVQWIDQELQSMAQDKDVIKLIQDTSDLNTAQGSTLTTATYLQHTFRDAASHVGILDRRVRSGYPTINPDNLPDQRRYRTALAVIERLARKTIEQGMQN